MLRERSLRWLPALVLAACLTGPTLTSAQAPPPPQPQQDPAAQTSEPTIRGLERLSQEERAQAERVTDHRDR